MRRFLALVFLVVAVVILACPAPPLPLPANSVYNGSLVSSSGTQLASFPITTALINPSNLPSAAIEMVVHTSNNTLASARIQVSLKF